MDWDARRRRMVEGLVRDRGIREPRVVEAMLQVPRHLFLDEALRDRAYGEGTLPIGHGQTISQAYTVARMTELLAPGPGDTVLEVGTGSGYQAAVLSRLCDRVISLERIPPLAERAKGILRRIGCRNVFVRVTDGSVGLSSRRLFRKILVTAGAPAVPPSLMDQLEVGGRMVLPVGPDGEQVLSVVERTPRGFLRHDVEPCGFVPLIGEEGFRHRAV